MKLLDIVFTGLICCNAFWAVSCASEAGDPPVPSGSSVCDSKLVFSSKDSSSSSSSRGNNDINRRSLSPWSWRTSTDKNRIPLTLWEAECNGSFCSRPNPQHKDGLSLNSVPIYQNILILTRNDSSPCFTASYRSVAVGCTCVWAKIIQN
ncbi:interleukin-17F-like [Thalassophryne amazonica]|uniref:interleukin-17F-like n=1 Tax=Thalassophryne amazonica TaxID=390379 RepID=UPI001471C06E|nr:interleukin-17F-like [Thalassophryne amazonica]